MSKNNLKAQLPTALGSAKISIPSNITQEELTILYKVWQDTLARLAELNPDLDVQAADQTGARAQPNTDRTVISGDEVGGFVTSHSDARDSIAKKAGLFLRNYREKRAFQRTEIAEKTKMSYSSVFNLEKGMSVPSIDTLSRFASIYGCDVKIAFIKNNAYDDQK